MPRRCPRNGKGDKTPLLELVGVFLKLGAVSFGGPAAHIALMEDEVVRRRRWLTREHFLDLVGATNLIPGPNSTEMAIHIGYLRAGWPGLIMAGGCFILPAVLLTVAFAWTYVQFGALPTAAPWLMGIKPVAAAVIFIAIWRLGKAAAKNWRLAALGVLVAASAMLGLGEVAALLLGGLIGSWLVRPGRTPRVRLTQGGAAVLFLASGAATCEAAATGVVAMAQVPLWKLGLFFLKIGSVLYGSGYVLVAFLQGGLVRGHGWLTQAQLLDAIAIGQITPGPVLSTATCIGYLLAGPSGAAVATLAIFLPSFVFVAALAPVLPRLRRLRWAAAFLDAVNVSAVALMGVALIQLGRASLTDWRAWLIALAAAVTGIRWKINPAWLVLGGAVAGWGFSVV